MGPVVAFVVLCLICTALAVFLIVYCKRRRTLVIKQEQNRSAKLSFTSPFVENGNHEVEDACIPDPEDIEKPNFATPP